MDPKGRHPNHFDGALHFVASFPPALKRERAGAILVVSSGYVLVLATWAPIIPPPRPR